MIISLTTRIPKNKKTIETATQAESAILVIIAPNAISQSRQQEIYGLVKASGVVIKDVITGGLRAINPKTFIGLGKLTEIKMQVDSHCANLVVFDNELSPGQQRNIEKFIGVRVLARTEIILDIFAKRARTYEGKLQVELAQLEHLKTRLVRGWTHLERQKGGIGLRGPGETQLETDRRLVSDRIKSLKKRLEKVHKQRQNSRRSRQSSHTKTIALVGYTNAGKSTLFNRLTKSNVMVKDQVFVTLDPTLRKLNSFGVDKVILADTVGFIKSLPHQLVEAFRATLEEVSQADLLLHVVDASDPDRRQHMQAVTDVLAEIKADDIPQLQVFNKIDQVKSLKSRLVRDEFGLPSRFWLSALNKDNVNVLKTALSEYLDQDSQQYEIIIDADNHDAKANVYQMAQVEQEIMLDSKQCKLTVNMHPFEYERLMKKIAS